MEYKIVVDAFEGPLDVLLNLIEKSKIDIYDIPINIITEQYLDYIGEIEDFDLDVTSEFIVMAATLMEIKSKMLLPIEQILDDEEEEDPRDELVRRLIEYKLFKEMAIRFKETEEIESMAYYKPREEFPDEVDKFKELGQLDLFKLVKTLNNIIKRNESSNVKKEDTSDEILIEKYSIKDCTSNIKYILKKSKKILFSELFEKNSSKEEIITYFLALLELSRLKEIVVKQNDIFDDLIIISRLEV